MARPPFPIGPLELLVGAQAVLSTVAAALYLGSEPALVMGATGLVATAIIAVRHRFIPAARQAPASGVVHAVRDAAAPKGEGYSSDARCFFVELSWRALGGDGPAIAPLTIEVRDAEARAPGAGRVFDARVFDEARACWQPIEAGRLAADGRLRLYCQAPAGDPAWLALWAGGHPICMFDTGRTALAPAPPPPEVPEHPGECARCGDMGLLDPDELCAGCRTLRPCPNHPQERSPTACLTCRASYCPACLEGGRCAGCRGRYQPSRRPVAAAVGPRPAKGRPTVEPRAILAASIAVLLLVQAGTFYLYYWESEPPASPEQIMRQRIGIAQGGIDAYRAEQGKLPADAAALAAALRAAGAEPPPLAGAQAKAPAGTVVYAPKGPGYKLWVVGEDGKQEGLIDVPDVAQDER